MHVNVHEYLSGWDGVKMKARGIAQAGSPQHLPAEHFLKL
jgi:hypothetical protein